MEDWERILIRFLAEQLLVEVTGFLEYQELDPEWEELIMGEG